MSLPHATRSKEGAPPRSTRQLLDELDTLMNQMLALPVEDDPNIPPPPPPPPPAAKPTLAATLTMIDAEGEAEADILPLRAPSTPAAAPALHLAEESPSEAPPWTAGIFDAPPPTDEAANKPQSGFALVGLDDEAATDALLAVDIVQPRPTSKSPRQEPARRPMPRSSATWTTGTLVVWDRGFRRLTRRLGLFGSLLRTAGGRVVLGVCGLSFWIISLAWLVLDWLRWTR